MTPFQHLLQDHRLWGIRRRTSVPAVAVGFFIAFLPMPGHMLMAALLALLFRVNIPIAVLATWISNPVTMGPMYYFSYRFGRGLLDTPLREFEFEMSWDWVTHTFVTIWQPMLLGCVILGTAAAILAYVILDLFWRSSITDYKSRKRNNRQDKNA